MTGAPMIIALIITVVVLTCFMMLPRDPFV